MGAMRWPEQECRQVLGTHNTYGGLSRNNYFKK